MEKTQFNILYLEDNHLQFEIYKSAINKAMTKPFNVGIDQTAYVEEALNMIFQKKYDLLIVDLNVIDSKSYETFERIKEAVLVYTPIIVVTGIEDKKIKARCIKAGVEGYFIKGINDRNMVSMVLTILLEQEKFKKITKA